ncbi:MAG: hypothetical protein BWY88_00667 [Synergistetes bacterium ADurb.Bin520]|nr:MAG: hypothetical protein BWY88_00667 [Synergistetes bacterium ADurb.Bin520]
MTARSAILKIGARGSRLTATMVPQSLIPIVCWMAPEIPKARQSRPVKVFPDEPTMRSRSSQPLSTAALEPPTGAPRSSPSSCNFPNNSPFSSPFPPETRKSASARSTSRKPAARIPRCRTLGSAGRPTATGTISALQVKSGLAGFPAPGGKARTGVPAPPTVSVRTAVPLYNSRLTVKQPPATCFRDTQAGRKGPFSRAASRPARSRPLTVIPQMARRGSYLAIISARALT